MCCRSLSTSEFAQFGMEFAMQGEEGVVAYIKDRILFMETHNNAL